MSHRPIKCLLNSRRCVAFQQQSGTKTHRMRLFICFNPNTEFISSHCSQSSAEVEANLFLDFEGKNAGKERTVDSRTKNSRFAQCGTAFHVRVCTFTVLARDFSADGNARAMPRCKEKQTDIYSNRLIRTDCDDNFRVIAGEVLECLLRKRARPCKTTVACRLRASASGTRVLYLASSRRARRARRRGSRGKRASACR